ncbi:MAG: hypothetical protein NTW87_17520 [Planctomycetota bacterium]|nr:hypothetical protein [Planctomycetota bacterium]
MMTMFLRCAFLIALAASCVAAGEKLLQPMAGPGAGKPVDGLRATASMVKSDFGPGESLLVVWQLTNESGKAVELSMDKKIWYDFAFEIRRDGNRVEPVRTSAKQRPDYRASTLTLEPGETTKQFIDLSALDWTDPKWAEPYGKYEVSVVYLPKRLQSGWAGFRIIPVAEVRRPPATLNQTERIRNLIAQLSDNEFVTRNQAYQDLLAIGAPALPLLEEVVATGGDTEAVRRCKKLLAEIKLKINPPPPPPPPPPRPVPPEPPLEF